MAGCCCMLFVYPLEFARTRLGVDVGKKGKTQFKGVFDCFRYILRTNGIKGVY